MVEKRKEQKIVEISYTQYSMIMNKLVSSIKSRLGEKRLNICSGVYGVPRGGLPIAVHLSHHLGLPLLEKPEENCIVCDDISDSGNTLEPFTQEGYFIVTLFCKKKTRVIPNVYFKMVPEESWIQFSWEARK